ncbi:MAG: S8 family serine peptidase, partial [Chitinophagales bacterium]
NKIDAISQAAIEGRNGKGLVVVFAAGNNSTNISTEGNEDAITGFATHPHVIAVAACNSKDERASYSNYGKRICLCAPSSGQGGAEIVTAGLSDNLKARTKSKNTASSTPYNDQFGGTAAASAIVSGVVALVLSVNPDLTSADVRYILEQTADKINVSGGYDQEGHSIYVGYGRVNAKRAVEMARAYQAGSRIFQYGNNAQIDRNQIKQSAQKGNSLEASFEQERRLNKVLDLYYYLALMNHDVLKGTVFDYINQRLNRFSRPVVEYRNGYSGDCGKQAET